MYSHAQKKKKFIYNRIVQIYEKYSNKYLLARRVKKNEKNENIYKIFILDLNFYARLLRALKIDFFLSFFSFEALELCSSV